MVEATSVTAAPGLSRRRNIAHDLFQGTHGRGQNHHVRIVDDLAQLPFRAIDCTDFLGLALPVEIRIESDDFERWLPLTHISADQRRNPSPIELPMRPSPTIAIRCIDISGR